MPIEILNPQNSELKALYNLSDIDKNTIAEIEIAKTNLQLHFNDYQEMELRDKIESLFMSMSSIMQKYSDNYIDKPLLKVKIGDSEREISFQDLVQELENIPIYKNTLKFILQNGIYIYNKFLREYLKVALRIEKENSKKKSLNRLFSFVNTTNLYKPFVKEYKEIREKIQLKNTPLNWLSYLLSKGSMYDLDFTLLLFGYARIGKSTLALHIIRRILAFKEIKPLQEIDKEIIEKEILKQILFYDLDDLDKAKDIKESFRFFDEALFVGDKRESMMPNQIKLLKILNAYAKYHNINIIVIQNPMDLDMRLIRKANIIIPIVERGYAQVHIIPKNFPFVNDIFPLTDLSKEVYVFMSSRTGIDRLHSLPSFVFDVYFSNLENKRIFREYDKLKDIAYQKKVFNYTAPQNNQIDIISILQAFNKNLQSQKEKV